MVKVPVSQRIMDLAKDSRTDQIRHFQGEEYQGQAEPAAGPRLKVSADGVGVVSHAGVGLLREVADLSGLSSRVSEVLADTFKGLWLHDPGRVFTDLAAAVADGADCVSGIGHLVDQKAQHGPVASVTTSWRLIDKRIDAEHLAGVKRPGPRPGRCGRPAVPRNSRPRW